MEKLAIDGGIPIRNKMLNYGRQSIDETDIQAVTQVLRGDWLTTGPMVGAFEKAVADYIGVKEAVAVNSGTAALHAAAFAADIGPGDEVIVPPITFVASANCILYMGGKPVFADVLPDTLNLDNHATMPHSG
jgi:perosamine synthetase